MLNYIIERADTGQHLAVQEIGEGRPIVLLTGLGISASLWFSLPSQARLAELVEVLPWGKRRLLAPALSDFGRVVTYDRAGLGQSSPPLGPRSLAAMTSELEQVVSQLELNNILLVGHSLGGAIALNYTLQHKSQVAGLLLIDSSHPNQIGRYRSGDSQQQIVRQKQLHDRYSQEHPERPDFPRLLDCKKALLPKILGDLPLTVLTSNTDVTTEVRARHPDDSLSDLKRWNNTRLILQKELAALSENTRHLQAHHCGHMIYLDDPELVISSVQELFWRTALTP